jgi:hypothetical protein
MFRFFTTANVRTSLSLSKKALLMSSKKPSGLLSKVLKTNNTIKENNIDSPPWILQYDTHNTVLKEHEVKGTNKKCPERKVDTESNSKANSLNKKT